MGVVFRICLSLKLNDLGTPARARRRARWPPGGSRRLLPRAGKGGHDGAQLPNAGVGLAQLAGRDSGAGFGAPGPVPNHAGHDVQLAAQLRYDLLSRHDALDRRTLERRAQDPTLVRCPWTSRRILRPHGAQSNRGTPCSSLNASLSTFRSDLPARRRGRVAIHAE